MGIKLWVPLLILFLVGCASKQTAIQDIEGLDPTAAADGFTELNSHVWTGLNGKPVRALTRNRNYPLSPTSIERITVLDFPTERGDKYGQRIVGLLVPPETGKYRFWVSSDDSAEVWLSSDQTPINKRLIAYNNLPTGYLNYTLYNSQRSQLIDLVAGERYYFEVLHKEYTAEDYLNVSWEGPGVPLSAITEANLLPFALADQVSGETAYKEGYHVGYTSGSLLASFDDTYPAVDTDGDGLPDFYETAIGNDLNDPTDAFNDLDGDLLTSYEEYQIRSNPNNSDTDGDGMPDGYEFVYGLAALNPQDATLDFDGDGISNIDEYNAGTTPNDSADFPTGPIIRTVSLQWEVPTSREDGSALGIDEIEMYKIYAGNDQTNLEPFTEINDPQQVSYSSDLVEGQYYFAISTVTKDGLEGPMSEPISVTVQ